MMIEQDAMKNIDVEKQRDRRASLIAGTTWHLSIVARLLLPTNAVIETAGSKIFLLRNFFLSYSKSSDLGWK